MSSGWWENEVNLDGVTAERKNIARIKFSGRRIITKSNSSGPLLITEDEQDSWIIRLIVGHYFNLT